MTELRRRMIQDMELRGLKENTQKAYVEAVKGLARHFNRSPDLLSEEELRLSEEELRRFFVYLTKVRRCAKSTLRVYLFGIKFLFKHTLRRPLGVFDLIRLRRDRKLPTVLSRTEVRQLLTGIRRPQARVSALLMYSCGLRVSGLSRYFRNEHSPATVVGHDRLSYPAAPNGCTSTSPPRRSGSRSRQRGTGRRRLGRPRQPASAGDVHGAPGRVPVGREGELIGAGPRHPV